MKKRLAVLIGVIVLLIGGGIAYAAIPGPDGVIHGCYKNSNPAQGALIAIDSAASCPSGYTALNWNQAGLTGPPGPVGPTGPQGSPGVSGSVLVNNSQGFSVNPGSTFQLSASCPSGKVALSGGGNSDRDLAVLRGSAPTNPTPPSLASGWTVQFKFIGDAADTVTVDAWVVCAIIAA